MAAIAKLVLFSSLIVFNAAKYDVVAEQGSRTGTGPFLLGTTDLMLAVHRNRHLLQNPQNSDPHNGGEQGRKKSKSKTVLLTGAAGVGGFLAVGLLLLLLIWPKKLYEHWKKRRNQLIRAEQRIVVQHIKEESVTFDPRLPRMSMTDLATATNDFDKNRVIGDGGFGFVYKAFLPDGTVVAVKKLSMDACQGIREFHAEMETLGRIRHPNLVEILGYCIFGQERLLIYKFMENGSLDEWLHEKEDAGKVLDWRKRVKIIRGVAAGLSFLHNDCNPHIIHRDIKGSNILLDRNFEARITDFGLARHMNPHKSHISTQAAGTLGYMPPEYASGTKANEQADVYSFGMVMMEIATGRRPNLHIMDTNKRTLRNWVHGLVKDEKYMDLLDPSLKISFIAHQHSEEELVKFFKIACECTDYEVQQRPAIRDVVTRLAAIVSQDMT